MCYFLTIYLKPHLVKYVNSFTNKENLVLTVKTNNHVSTVIKQYLIKKREFYSNTTMKELNNYKLEGYDPIDIKVSKNCGVILGWFVKPYDFKELNDTIDVLFRSHCATHVKSARLYNSSITISDAILDFMKQYDISEDDIALETIQRYLFRYFKL